MGRASKAQASEHREQVVEAASRLFRERGTVVSVADLMAAVGLTHGGFYKQFASKSALLGEATERAFEDLQARLAGFDAAHPGDHDAARAALVDYYLSPGHRDDLARGCPASGLAVDMARQDVGSPARTPYATGVADLASWLGDRHGGSAGAATPPGDDELASLCTLVGALVLARATVGSEISDRLLAAGRAAVAGTD